MNVGRSPTMISDQGFQESGMNDQDAFLRAIGATSNDSGLRLVYADWLEERGDPVSACRAEYLRVECEQERLRWGHGARLLEARLITLIDSAGSEWCHKVARIPYGRAGRTYTQKGFRMRALALIRRYPHWTVEQYANRMQCRILKFFRGDHLVKNALRMRNTPRPGNSVDIEPE
jgi:uncharacterized protein (TIGR02996 family)